MTSTSPEHPRKTAHRRPRTTGRAKTDEQLAELAAAYVAEVGPDAATLAEAVRRMRVGKDRARPILEAARHRARRGRFEVVSEPVPEPTSSRPETAPEPASEPVPEPASSRVPSRPETGRQAGSGAGFEPGSEPASDRLGGPVPSRPDQAFKPVPEPASSRVPSRPQTGPEPTDKPASESTDKPASSRRFGWGTRSAQAPYSARLAEQAAESERIHDTLAAHPELFHTPGEAEIKDKLRHHEQLRRAQMARELRKSEHDDAIQAQQWDDQEAARQETAERARLASPAGRIAAARLVGRLGTRLAAVLMGASVVVGAINVHTNWAGGLTAHDPMWWGWWVFDPIATIALVALLILRARYAQLGARLGEGIRVRGREFGPFATWAIELLFFLVTAYMNGHGDWDTGAQIIAHTLPPVLLVGAQLLQWLNAGTSAHLVSTEAQKLNG